MENTSEEINSYSHGSGQLVLQSREKTNTTVSFIQRGTSNIISLR